MSLSEEDQAEIIKASIKYSKNITQRLGFISRWNKKLLELKEAEWQAKK